MKKNKLAVIALILALFCCGAYADPLLSLLPPGGSVAGAPGQTVGWGYSISNNTAYYLFVDASYFCQPGQDPAFTTCTQTHGAYTDYIGANATVVPPSVTPQIESFNSTTLAGVGAYAIDAAAPMASTDIGELVITYQEYSGDPFSGGTQISGDIELTAAASVHVQGTPEPATWLLAAAGLLSFAALRKAKAQLPVRRSDSGLSL